MKKMSGEIVTKWFQRCFSQLFFLLLISSSFSIHLFADQRPRVSLRSVQNGQYVRAGVDAECYLSASSNRVAAWETFELIDRGGNRIALRSWQAGKYVRAGVTQESLLAAQSNGIGSWESFELVRLGNNRVALRSVQSQNYVRAGVGNRSLLAASSRQISGWETFEMGQIAAPDPVDSVMELATRLGCHPVGGAPRGSIRLGCPSNKMAEFANTYISRSKIDLSHRDGKNYIWYRFGPVRIPEMDFTQPDSTRKRSPNIYVGPGGMYKFLFNGIDSNSISITGSGNTMTLDVQFEASGTEFKVEMQTRVGGWQDYAAPDAHWDQARIRLELSFADNISQLAVNSIRVSQVRGAWGIRGLNGLAPDSLNNSVNGSIRDAFNEVLQDSAMRDGINLALGKVFGGGVLSRLGVREAITVGFSQGEFIITLPASVLNL